MNDFLNAFTDDIDDAELLYDGLTLRDLSVDIDTSDNLGSDDSETAIRRGEGMAAEDRSEDPLLLYLRELSKYPLLTGREEPLLLRQLSDDTRHLQALLAMLLEVDESTIPSDHAGLLKTCSQLLGCPAQPLDRKHRRRLGELHSRVKSARERVINANLRLVVHISKRYWTPLYSMTDLIQEGNLGLLRAVERFDVSKGYRFSTYAYWWIQQRVFRYVSDRWRIIRLPSNVADELRVWKRLSAKKAAAPQRPLPPKEEDKLARLDQKYLGNPLLSTEHTLSLDRPVAEDSAPTLAQTIAIDQPGTDTQVMRDHTAALVHRHIATLSRREQTVIRMRYGIGVTDKYTCREISRQIGVSVERVRQIEHEAIAKLRRNALPLVNSRDPG